MDDGTDGWMENFRTSFNICNACPILHTLPARVDIGRGLGLLQLASMT